MALQRFHGHALPCLRHDDGTDALAEHFVRIADDGALGDVRMLCEHGVDLVRRDFHAAAVDQLLPAPDELIVAAGRVDLEQVAGAEPAIRRESARRDLGRAKVAVEHDRPADLHLAGPMRLDDLAAVFRIDEARVRDLGDALLPIELRPAEAREQSRACFRVRRLGGSGTQRDTFVRAEVVDDLDAVPLLVGPDHHRRQRRRTRANTAQARQVDAVQQRFVLEQQHQYRGRRNRILGLLGRDLLQVDRQLERVMEDERAGSAQPAHEAAAERRHVDERKRIQQPVAATDLCAVVVTQAAGDPVIV